MTNLGYCKGPSASEARPRDASTVSIVAWHRGDQFLGRTTSRLGDSEHLLPHKHLTVSDTLTHRSHVPLGQVPAKPVASPWPAGKPGPLAPRPLPMSDIPWAGNVP